VEKAPGESWSNSSFVPIRSRDERFNLLDGDKHMTRALAATLAGLLALVCSPLAQTGGGRLQISWIDVEGGASTLFAAPNGQSLLFDTGFPGNDDRDAKRIVAAAKAMGLTRIDHVVISHWHGDHVGGLPALAKLLPLGTFYDHGDGVEQSDRPLYEGYKTIAGTKRHIVKPGETITLGDVRVRVLVAEGPVIADAVNGGTANPLCTNAARQEPAAPENIRMVGLAINYGRFKMATLGDADWSREMELACPVNKLGRINLYTINRHGSLDNSGAPALLGAIQPQVIVVNNGPRKGLGQKVAVKYVTRQGETPTPYELNSYLRLAKLPAIEGIWQGHQSLLDADPAHNTAPDLIANLEEGASDQGHTITAAVSADGTFTVTNSRNGFARTYRAR
jgi:beta-lactamase superfamily II metal-dependent hydrolase